MNWATYPFLRLLIALSAGIWLNSMLATSINSIGVLTLFCSVIFTIYFITDRFFKGTLPASIRGFVALASFVVLGYLNAHLFQLGQSPRWSSADLQKITQYTAKVISKPAKTSKTFKYEVIIEQVKSDKQWLDFSYRALLYVVTDKVPNFEYGERLLVKGRPEYIGKQTNPHAFDYAKYMRLRGIHLQSYSNVNNYLMIGSNQHFSLKMYSMLVGDYLEKKLTTLITSARELEMIKAMVLGRREEVSSEMEYVYRSTGTAHILAVSGLHVGIIFLVISGIFRSLKRKPWRWIYYSLVVTGIWSFAFVTGSSPSVLRASLMLSVIIIAELLGRKSNVYNSIFVSAFALLIYNPNLLFSVSFQLSYAAVLGIVYLYKRIYKLLYVKGAIADFFWKISALSLSVQITTFPITIYYFHQFPTLFLITNMIAIPTATMVIAGSLILLIISALPTIPAGVAYLLEHWVYFYNQFLTFLSGWTYTNIEDIYIRGYYVLILICLMILLTKFFEKKQLSYMRYFTFTLLFMAGITFYDHMGSSRQRKVIFYDVGDKCFIDVFIGSNCYSNIDQKEGVNSDVAFNVIPNRKYNRIAKVLSLDDCAQVRTIGENTLLKLGEKTLFLLRDSESLSATSQDLKIDYLVISKGSIKNLHRLTGLFQCNYLIFDGSIDDQVAANIKKNFNRSPVIHSVARDGAYIISI
jgi:competence protein ComEC